MTKKEKRTTLLLAKLIVSEQTLKSEKQAFSKMLDKNKLSEIVNEEHLWKGYQPYNFLMREQGETDYQYLNQSQVSELHTKIKKLL